MRRVYFSFDYERDLDRVNKIRKVPGVLGGSAAGFASPEVWLTASMRGEASVQGLVRDALNNTTVTVVCIGHLTAYRKFLNFELEESLNRGNGMVAIKIDHITNKAGEVDQEGFVPPLIKIAGYKTYKYLTARHLAEWIEEAAEIAAEQAQSDHQKRVLMSQRGE